MINFYEFLDERITEARRKNFEDTKNLHDIESIRVKIHRDYQKYVKTGYITVDEETYAQHVISQIRSGDAVYLARYSKDPIRQTFHEAIQKLFFEIKFAGILKNIRKPPSRGKNALYETENGEVKSGFEMENEDRGTNKSIDLAADYEFEGNTTHTLHLYFAQKFTEDDGGNQDNQFNDATGFAKNSSKTPLSSGSFGGCILDGDYYTKKYRKRGKNFDGSRLEYINLTYGGGLKRATCSDELEDLVFPVLIKWLEGLANEDQELVNKEIERLKKEWKRIKGI